MKTKLSQNTNCQCHPQILKGITVYINARKQQILIPAPTSNDFILIRCWLNKYYWFLIGNLLYDKLSTSTAWFPLHLTTHYPFQCWQPTGTPPITGDTFYNRVLCTLALCAAAIILLISARTDSAESSGVPRNFVRGGFNRFSCGQRTERKWIWRRLPASQGFWRQL